MYQKPSWLITHVFNPMASIPARLGLSIRGAQVLTVAGRTTGTPRSTPVNPLVHDGADLSRGAARGHAVGAQPAGGEERGAAVGAAGAAGPGVGGGRR